MLLEEIYSRMFLCDSRGTLRDNACAVVSRAFGVLCLSLSLKCLVNGSQPSKWPYDLTLRCPCCRKQRVCAMGLRCGVTTPGVWPHLLLSKSLALRCALLSRCWCAWACMDKPCAFDVCPLQHTARIPLHISVTHQRSGTMRLKAIDEVVPWQTWVFYEKYDRIFNPLPHVKGLFNWGVIYYFLYIIIFLSGEKNIVLNITFYFHFSVHSYWFVKFLKSLL